MGRHVTDLALDLPLPITPPGLPVELLQPSLLFFQTSPERTERRLRAQDIEVEFTEEAVELFFEEDVAPEFGARPLRRTIQRRVDNELSRMLLDGAEEGQLTFEVLEGATVGVAGTPGE